MTNKNKRKENSSKCNLAKGKDFTDSSSSSSPSTPPPEFDIKVFGLKNDKNEFNYAIELKHGDFKPENYFYPQTLQSTINPIVKKFFEMNSDSIASRYAQINPTVNINRLKKCLYYKPKYFKWSGKSFQIFFNIFLNRSLQTI